MFVPGQSIPFHFGAGLEHVRKRTLFPSPHVTLHGCHDDHWLQLPFTDEKKKTFHDMKALEKVSNAEVLNCWLMLLDFVLRSPCMELLYKKDFTIDEKKVYGFYSVF